MRHMRSYARIAVPATLMLALAACSASPTASPSPSASSSSTSIAVSGLGAKGYTASVSVGITVRDATTSTASADIAFEPGSAQLTGAARTSLDAMLGTIPVGMASRCTASPVTGPDNSVPSDIALSTARADTTAAYLTAHGLACATDQPRADTTGSPDPERLVNVKVAYDH